MQVYIYQAALYCEECGEQICEELDAEGKRPADVENEASYDSDEYPKGPMDEGESDSPSFCDDCGCFLETSLTEYGVKSVRNSVIKQIRRTPQMVNPDWLEALDYYEGEGVIDYNDIVREYFNQIRRNKR